LSASPATNTNPGEAKTARKFELLLCGVLSGPCAQLALRSEIA
jgi:hypothetical protein